MDPMGANGAKFEIKQLLLADDTDTVAASQKYSKLVSKFGRVPRRRWE